MQNHLKFILISTLSLALAAQSCRKQGTRTSGQIPDPFAQYDEYYPLKDSNEWNYKLVIEDFLAGRTDTISQKSIYLKAKERIDYFYNSQFRGYSYWERYGSKLMCCGDQVLIDFGQLECNGDSVRINRKQIPEGLIETYQQCGFKYLTTLKPYESVKCIRTFQENTYDDGTKLQLIHYFGQGVGLIYRGSIKYDNQGKITRKESGYLQSHRLR